MKAYDISNIYKEMTLNEEEIKINNAFYQNQIYEKEFFDTIPIIEDGNAFIGQYHIILIKMKNNIQISDKQHIIMSKII